MGTYHKITRPDGTDWYTGMINYAAALETGEPVTVPETTDPCCGTGDVLHAADTATAAMLNCSFRADKVRLFEVEGEPVANDRAPHEFGFHSLRVVREMDPSSVPRPSAV